MSLKNRAKIVEWHDVPSGFLINPLDEDGNRLVSPKYEDVHYWRYDLVKTTINGYQSIKEDVAYNVGGDVWTNSNVLLSQNYKNNKLLFDNAPVCLYSCLSFGYYLLFIYSTGVNKIRIYTIAGVFKQEIVIAEFTNAPVFIDVNKSGAEFLIFGKIANNAPPVEVDFDFDLLIQGDSLTTDPTAKWYAIGRYSISESGNDLAPIDVANVSYVEQWRGYFYKAEKGDLISATGYPANPPTFPNPYTVSEYEVAVTSEYLSSIILHAYYDADTYTEILFEPTAITFSGILTEIVDDVTSGVLFSVLGYEYDFAFSVGGLSCSDILTDLGHNLEYYEVSNTRYSKVNPYFKNNVDDNVWAVETIDPTNFLNVAAAVNPNTFIEFYFKGATVDNYAFASYLDPAEFFINANQYWSIAVDKYGNHFIAPLSEFGSSYTDSIKITNKDLENVQDISQLYNFGSQGVI